MIIKEYDEFTSEEKDQTQKIWVEVLNTFCHTVDGTESCRPCDLGMPCDRCHYDWDLQNRYAKMLVERNLPLIPSEEKYL